MIVTIDTAALQAEESTPPLPTTMKTGTGSETRTYRLRWDKAPMLEALYHVLWHERQELLDDLRHGSKFIEAYNDALLRIEPGQLIQPWSLRLQTFRPWFAEWHTARWPGVRTVKIPNGTRGHNYELQSADLRAAEALDRLTEAGYTDAQAIYQQLEEAGGHRVGTYGLAVPREAA